MYSFKNLSFFMISIAAVSGQNLRGLTSGHGCLASAGETYCPETQSCIRPWEENCPIQGQGFHGELVMKCNNGRCSDLKCSLYDYNNNISFKGPYVEELKGYFYLPAGCSATCDDNCQIDNIPDPDVDGHGCKGSAGYTYCPETKKCIRFDENCPINGGTKLTGSKELSCSKGARLSDLTKECTLIQKQSDGTSVELSGPYVSDMESKYVLPEGCSATVVGCTTQNLLG